LIFLRTQAQSLSERLRLTVAEIDRQLRTAHQIRMKAVCHGKSRPATETTQAANRLHLAAQLFEFSYTGHRLFGSHPSSIHVLFQHSGLFQAQIWPSSFRSETQ
jgi:hypothetical protein